MAKAGMDPTTVTAKENEAHTPMDSVEASEDVDFIVENVRAHVSTPVVRMPSKQPGNTLQLSTHALNVFSGF